MQQELYGPEHHQQRSEFIRRLVQRRFEQPLADDRLQNSIPKTIVQYWHDLNQLPRDVEDCIGTWSRWNTRGFEHRIFDERAAQDFISESLGTRYRCAFERCYHPAMQADYFRLCYLLVEGGCYVDADDVCISTEISWLFEDGRLKLQPLCYDVASGAMVKPSVFLCVDAYDPSWIFYFNNNPLIARPRHPIIERALSQATALLDLANDGELPEIQATTWSWLRSKSLSGLGMERESKITNDVVILRDWEVVALSRWPLSYRDDARNWRLSNQVSFFK